MINTNEQVTISNASLFKIFRLVFVLFSLYLLSDVFFRWDGFRHYASFSEFVPAVFKQSQYGPLSAKGICPPEGAAGFEDI